MGAASAVLALAGAALGWPAVGKAHDYVRILSEYQGPNTVVVNYNVDQLQAGLPTTFNFRLYQIADGRLLEFETVNVRFTRDGTAALAVALPRSPGGDAVYTYTFPAAGSFALETEFVKSKQTLARATFPLAVQKGLERERFTLSVENIVIGLGLGLAIGWVARAVGPGWRLGSAAR
jgi:hypothetical protein